MSPIVVLGMHRSGTSLTARLLRDLGVHMGSFLSRDAESVHFQKINRRIYKSADSNWGNIDSLLRAMKSDRFIQEQTDRVLKSLFPDTRFFRLNMGMADFFGPKLWKTLTLGKKIYWGWKDPRTTITFPIWLRVFPQSRILHILRNGVDVAISTHRRSQRQHQKIWKRIYPLDYYPETLDFEYCFQLWERYVSFVLDHKRTIPVGHYMELSFEDLLANPKEKLRDISEFLEFEIQNDLLDIACERINQDRLNNMDYARPYHDQIKSLASRPLMKRLGYSYTVRSGSERIGIGR